MSDELLDIVDDNDKPTGITKMKSLAHGDGSWHRCAHVWIYNSKSEVLLQFRSHDKLLYPDKWDVSAAGHIGAGEDVLTGAQREIEEEIGIKVKKQDLYFFKKLKVPIHYHGMINNEFYYIYLYKYNGSINNLKLQIEEVAAIKLMPVDKVKKEFIKDPNKFTPNKDYWFSVLDKIQELNSRK